MTHFLHNDAWRAKVAEAGRRGMLAARQECPINRVAASDQDEAIRMIRAGDTNAKIMDWFGWTREKVERLRDRAREMGRVG